MNDVTFFDSENKDSDHPDPISQKLLQVPVGHHYLLLYSDLAKIRQVYSKYVRMQLETQPDSIIVILPFYENTEKVREALEANNIDVKKLVLQNTLIIVDMLKVVRNEYYGVSDVERLRAFIKQVEEQHPDMPIFVIADMSAFQLLKKSSELMEYERTLHKDLKRENWKEICLYHKRDFESMFNRGQSDELLNYHKDRVIKV
jgi:KaiC/GvpD/RAD55 family RecA-like ATPase